MSNKILSNINIKNTEVVGDRFLKANENLRKLDISNLREYGHDFIPNNRKVKIKANSLSFKDKIYTNHIRKIKKTWEIIKKLSIYNRRALNNKQAIVRGAYNGQMLGMNDDLDDMFDYGQTDERGRWI